MQIHRISYGIRGFGRITSYAIRYTRMVTNKAKHKAQVLAFWTKHGLEATLDAFSVKKRTLYYWQAQLKKGGGQLEALNDKSRKPQKTRKRLWPNMVVAEISRLRTEHPNLGRDKIYPFLKEFCQQQGYRCPEIRTIGRLIADAPDKMRIFPTKVRHNGQIVQRKRIKKTRKPKHFMATHPGHCGSFDTIERIIHGSRRYILTFTDIYSRFALAWSTTSHASLAATEFLAMVWQLFPYRLEYVLTDNGSEFAKHFDQSLRLAHHTHWHTYPKTPKMNAHCERFNRTLQEEFVDYHESELLDPSVFNQKLISYLLWYNAKRPHWSLKLKSPIQFLSIHNQECNIWWPNTIACNFSQYQV